MPVPEERRVLRRLSREGHVDGVGGIRMIALGLAVPIDDGPASDVEVYAAAPRENGKI